MMIIFMSDLAKLNNPSMEKSVRLKYCPKRGTILEKSGVMGLAEKTKPTWSTLEKMAPITATAAIGRVSFMK